MAEPFATLSQFDFHQRLEAAPGVSLVCFGAAGCGACRAMHQALASLSETRPGFHLFEVDAQRDMALTREFEVFHLPSLFVFRDGHYHAPLHSEPSPERLLDALAACLRGPAQEAP